MNTRMDADGDDETVRVALDTSNLPSSVTAGAAASTTVTVTDTTTTPPAALVLFPNPPATVRADPGDGQAVLSWSAVAGAGGWEVRQGSGAWTATGSAATTHTVTGLTNGTAYTFRVRATQFNGLIKGTASAGVTVTAGLPSAPDAVASVRVSHRGSSLAVSWEAPARATHYDVSYSADGGTTWTGAASNRAGTSLSISGADSTKSYTVRVRARNAGGQAAWTRSESIPFAAPAAPAPVSVTHDGTSLAVSWAAPARAESYAVAYSADGGGTWATATPKQTGTGLTIGGVDGAASYTVRVRARNAAGLSGWTASAAVRGPLAGPDAVASVSVAHNGTSLGVSWTAPAGAASYDVTYTDANDISWQRAAWDRAGTGITITTNVDAAKTYLVGVRARNANGESAWVNSGPASRTPATAPDAVASVTVVHKGGSLDVSWEAPARATHYDVTYTDANAIAWRRAAWNRAGTGLTITANVDGTAAIDGTKTYLVGVRARNAAGESAWTNSAATAVPAPDRAGIWFVTPGAGRLDVYVVRPARTASYEARTKTGGGSDCGAGTWGAARAASHVHVPEFEADRIAVTGLTGGTAYCVQVRAANANGSKGAWSAAVAAATPEPALSVADATAAEPGAGQTATLDFVVTLDPASSGAVTVAYAAGKAGDTAAKGSDYTATTGTLTFAAGETTKTVAVPVLADSIDDGGETLTFTLSNASGASISDAEATGTITNEGPIPTAWLARFGRAAAADAVAAVTARLETPRDAGSHFTVGGQRLPFGDAGANTGAGLPAYSASGRAGASLPSWSGDPAADGSRTMSVRELLAGTSFRAVLGTGAGSQWTGWGQGASVSAFSSADPDLSLSGETATGSMGVDWERGRLIAGFAMTHRPRRGHGRGFGPELCHGEFGDDAAALCAPRAHGAPLGVGPRGDGHRAAHARPRRWCFGALRDGPRDGVRRGGRQGRPADAGRGGRLRAGAQGGRVPGADRIGRGRGAGGGPPRGCAGGGEPGAGGARRLADVCAGRRPVADAVGRAPAAPRRWRRGDRDGRGGRRWRRLRGPGPGPRRGAPGVRPRGARGRRVRRLGRVGLAPPRAGCGRTGPHGVARAVVRHGPGRHGAAVDAAGCVRARGGRATRPGRAGSTGRWATACRWPAVSRARPTRASGCRTQRARSAWAGA